MLNFVGMDKASVNGPESSGADEFGIYTDMADLPISGCPAYLKEGIGGVCLSGEATVQVFNTRIRIKAGVVVGLLPWQLASIKEISDDFRLTFFRVSQAMFTDSLSSLWRLTPEFFFYMHNHFASQPNESIIPRFLNYCDLLAYRMEWAPQNCRRESIMQLLRVFYWDVYVGYLNDPAANAVKCTRKEELAFRFMRLIIERRSPNTDVAYYAGELGVSPKYLTNLVKSISGQSARDWIVYYTILGIKALLRESSMDLKSIAVRVNFPDQSSLCRFFRRYAGMSPSQYRKNIYF